MVSSDPDFIITDKQITTISTEKRWIHQTQPQIPGISEEERQRRRESNKLSTRINFIGWILEVELPNWDSPRAILIIQYLFIATTLQLSGQLCWVDFWGGNPQLRQSMGNLEYPIPFHCHHLATFQSTLLGGFLRWKSFLANSNYGDPYLPMECLTKYSPCILYMSMPGISNSKHMSRPWVSS